jgi:hypothetical protein
MTARAIVGGVDYAVGGWGEYEVAQRHEQYRASGGMRRLVPAKLVRAEDVVKALGDAVWQRPNALRAALDQFAVELGRLEDRMCEPDESGAWECRRLGACACTCARTRAHAEHWTLTIPPLTSADVRAAAADSALASSAEAMRDFDAAVRAVATAMGAVATAMGAAPAATSKVEIVPLIEPAVAVSDDEAVLQLEESVLPHFASLEQMQAALASRIDAVTKKIAARNVQKC